jgi:hypothetical protein
LSTDVVGEWVSARALSCYTANLARYLEGDFADPLGRIARSVRLAVRTDLPGGELAISHHAVPLNDLADGSRLAYRSASAVQDMLDGITAEVAAHDRVVVVAYTSAMPWSVAYGGPGAPHFLLVDGHRAGGWHVTDEFSALVPGGRQEPFSGWIQTTELIECLRPTGWLRPEHRLRNEHAFGFPMVCSSGGHYQWLSREAARTGMPDVGGGGLGMGHWITDPVSALSFWADRWVSLLNEGGDTPLLEDMWACAQHHAFRYAHILASPNPSVARETALAARQAWQDLPLALRFAVDSARRGRRRASVVTATFGQLKRIEGRLAGVLAAAGYGLPASQVHAIQKGEPDSCHPEGRTR